MSNNPTPAVVERTNGQPAARSSAQVVASQVFATDADKLDWTSAVNTAAARLEEVLPRPDPDGHMLSLGVAAELAATLSAYGLTAAEADHERDRADRAALMAKRRRFDALHPAMIDAHDRTANTTR